MPFHKNSYKLGNLFIMFKVKFPDQLSIEQANVLRFSLENVEGQKTPPLELEDLENVKPMLKYEPTQRNTHHQGGTHANDSDDEKEHINNEKPGMQCGP